MKTIKTALAGKLGKKKRRGTVPLLVRAMALSRLLAETVHKLLAGCPEASGLLEELHGGGDEDDEARSLFMLRALESLAWNVEAAEAVVGSEMMPAMRHLIEVETGRLLVGAA